MKHIFISHAGKDSATAQDLARKLKDAGHETVVDVEELSLGDNSIDFMNQAIRDAHTIIILYSVHTPQANWQKLEIDASLWNEMAQSGGNCIVLRLDDTEIPPLLGRKLYGKLDINNSQAYQQTIEDICAAILPKHPASSIVSRAFGPSQNNPFRRIRAEYFEDEPALLARFFAAPDALKMGTLEDKMPCFLEGSRGTGKSMLLLSLRARNYLSRKPNSAETPQLFGFYLKLTRGAVCNAGIIRERHGDPSIAAGTDAMQIADLFMQEIVLDLLESLFSEIAFCTKSGLLVCGRSEAESLAVAASVSVYGGSAERPRSLEDLMGYFAQTHRGLAEYIRRKFIYAESPVVPVASLDLDLLKRVIGQIRELVPSLSGAQFVVLLDEYETLFPYQQVVVNTLVKHGPPSFSIKIAKKLGTGDNAGTTSGQELQETHDYQRILLVYDVEDKNQLAAYTELLQHFIERIFSTEGLAFTSASDLLPSSTDGVSESTITAEIARLCKVTVEEFVAWPKDRQREKSTYYREAAVYRVLYGGTGRHREKHFSGFKELTFLSSGVIRYFQEILGVAYYLQFAESPTSRQPMVLTSAVQSEAVHFVSRHNLTTLSRNIESVGEVLKYFLLDLGDCLRKKLLSHTSEPEAARITIGDPEALEGERFSMLKNLLMVGTREGVFQTKEGRPAFKPKHSSDPQPAEFNICRIYAPVLQISPRLRWRTNVSCESLRKLIQPADRTKGKKDLMKRICRSDPPNGQRSLPASE